MSRIGLQPVVVVPPRPVRVVAQHRAVPPELTIGQHRDAVELGPEGKVRAEP